ncbi:MAG TPA: hypothetical protein VFW07_14160 [Parafilimonas sp.]|nr:hypothetical protein [Parafilimonas sp.]
MRIKLINLGILIFIMGCANTEVKNNKDLEQNMMDVKIYQENMGDHIKAKDLEDASWLLEGMDSILLILDKQVTNHYKLPAPFSYYYKKELRKPIKGIREAIQDKDTAKALHNYRILVNNCNDCHIDNEIDKQVNF